MGWKYEVSVWVRPTDEWEVGNHYRYQHYAGTEWLIVALFHLWKARRLCECAMLQWR